MADKWLGSIPFDDYSKATVAWKILQFEAQGKRKEVVKSSREQELKDDPALD